MGSLTEKMNLENDVDLKEIASLTVNYKQIELSDLCSKALTISANEMIEDVGSVCVSKESFFKFLPQKNNQNKKFLMNKKLADDLLKIIKFYNEGSTLISKHKIKAPSFLIYVRKTKIFK